VPSGKEAKRSFRVARPMTTEIESSVTYSKSYRPIALLAQRQGVSAGWAKELDLSSHF
jgi:hypothetical protein